MNTKTIITTLLILFCSINLFSAQKAKLTKEETVKYINDLYLKSLNASEGYVKLDGKTLLVNFGHDQVFREYLIVNQPIEIIKEGDNYRIKDHDQKNLLLWGIPLENDAQRLKNALEHLIEILNAEPETDPFAN